MHELGIVIEIVNMVENIAKEQGLATIDTLVLQIGELSTVVPAYIEACYPAAVDGTIMEQTKLNIEILPGNGRCKDCCKVFNLLEHKRICPQCGGSAWELLGGKEFLIKEIIAC